MAFNKIPTAMFSTHSWRMPVGTTPNSIVRENREYLLSQEVADELNTYRTFDPFPTFNDLFAPIYDENGKEIFPTKDGKETSGSGTLGVRSLFNKSGAVILGVDQISHERIIQDWKSEYDNPIISGSATEFRIMNNVPLMDNPINREQIIENSRCTVKDLVKDSQQGLLGRATYSYADFMYCKYLGRMSNNYLITLRRFPYPVDDFISSLGIGETRLGGKHGEFQSQNADSVGCMVTWLGTPGNDITNILKYTVGMPFQEQKAALQENKIDADSKGGLANSIAAAFDPTYRQQFMKGQAGSAIAPLFGKFAFFSGEPPYPASQWNAHRDDTKVYGPVDVIKTTYTRSDAGLDFQQNIQLVFDYELRSYNGINPRQAMLDLISNILHVTYNTGTFWGGGFRGGGAHQNNIFTNLAIYKKGDQGRGLAGFIDSFAEDYSTLSKNAKSAVDSNGGLVETLKKLANTLGGMLLSGFLNKMGRPHKQMANSMLSPAPIGFWHLTVGNPHHPIMSIGNLILKTTTIQHYGPLGIDDFPTGLKVTCDLVRGKSRDIRDIEKLYMHGNDRIYTSMSSKVLDMYTHSKEYRSRNKLEVGKKVPYNGGNPDSNDVLPNTIQLTGLDDMQKVTLKYFGNTNTQSILIPAREQEHGAARKKEEETAGGTAGGSGGSGNPVVMERTTDDSEFYQLKTLSHVSFKYNSHLTSEYSNRAAFDNWVKNKLSPLQLRSYNTAKQNTTEYEAFYNTLTWEEKMVVNYLQMTDDQRRAVWFTALDKRVLYNGKDITDYNSMSWQAVWASYLGLDRGTPGAALIVEHDLQGYDRIWRDNMYYIDPTKW